MNAFYCVGCRGLVAATRLGQLIEAAHRDGAPVGFCLACLPHLLSEPAVGCNEAEPDGELSA